MSFQSKAKIKKALDNMSAPYMSPAPEDPPSSSLPTFKWKATTPTPINGYSPEPVY